jgi:hypothetical protein
MKEPRLKYSLSFLTAVMIKISQSVALFIQDFEYWLRTKWFHKISGKEKVMDDVRMAWSQYWHAKSQWSQLKKGSFPLAEKNRYTTLIYW